MYVKSYNIVQHLQNTEGKKVREDDKHGNICTVCRHDGKTK